MAAGGGHHYNEPGGYLFGEAPPPPGQKRVKEDWENLWIYGMGSIFLLGGIGLYFKPKKGVKDWAYEEAKARMEQRNETPDFTPTPKERWA